MKKVFFIINIILCVISFLYGISILNVNSGTLFYLIWFLISAFFIIIDLLIYFKVFERYKVFKKIFIWVCSIGICIFLVILSLIISKMNVKPVKNLDYIIVLGAQVKESGPSVVLRYRLDRAVSYLKENDNTLVIVSGGQGANEKATEASVMKEYLVNNAMQITNDVIGLFQAILAQNVEQTKIMLERLNNMPNIDVTKLNANVNGYIEMLEEKNRSLEMESLNFF